MILEIRTYRLKPGSRADFLQLFNTQSMPLLAKHGIDVVACEASLVDEEDNEEACLIRAFPSLDERQRQEDAFYGSDDWHEGPRQAIIEKIESYHTIVLEASSESH